MPKHPTTPIREKRVLGWAAYWKFTGEIHCPVNAPEPHDRTFVIFARKKDALEYKKHTNLMKVARVEIKGDFPVLPLPVKGKKGK